MRPSAAWSALQTDRVPLSLVVEYERGVWGKVHGAPTDFRWIARSSGFAADRRDLLTQLNLGGEDVPARFQAWRNLGDRCYAVTVYPSRATDAAGRRDFLEKQILEWRRPHDVPAAVGALLLLPYVATLTDEVWWNRSAGELAADRDAILPLTQADHEAVAVDEDLIGIAVERGRQELRDAVSPRMLERLYDQLLGERHPALLAGLHQPLSPTALAALLLPLPRKLADRISIAGWIPTHRPQLDDLGSRWEILVTAPDQALSPTVSNAGSMARRMAQALLRTDAAALPEQPQPQPAERSGTPVRATPLRPGYRLELTPPGAGAPAILDQLYDFAADSSRRWLDPESWRSSLRFTRLGDGAARLLSSWVQQMRDQGPGHAHSEQWNVKIDLLRSAAIVLAPSGSTIDLVGIPADDSRVPALLFGLAFEKRDQWDALAALGEKGLRRALAQSANCAAPTVLRDSLRRQLQQWLRETRRADLNVPSLLDALASPRH